MQGAEAELIGAFHSFSLEFSVIDPQVHLR